MARKFQDYTLNKTVLTNHHININDEAGLNNIVSKTWCIVA
jgi:hypothetical protein